MPCLDASALAPSGLGRTQHPDLQEEPKTQTYTRHQNPELQEAPKSRLTRGTKIQSYTRHQNLELQEVPYSRVTGSPKRHKGPQRPELQEAPTCRHTYADHTRTGLQLPQNIFGCYASPTSAIRSTLGEDCMHTFSEYTGAVHPTEQYILHPYAACSMGVWRVV